MMVAQTASAGSGVGGGPEAVESDVDEFTAAFDKSVGVADEDGVLRESRRQWCGGVLRTPDPQRRVDGQLQQARPDVRGSRA